MERLTVRVSSLTRRTRPFTRVNGKSTSSMDKVLKLGMMAKVSTKVNSSKARKLAGLDMSKMEMFMKAISLTESSMAKVNITLSILERPMKVNL